MSTATLESPASPASVTDYGQPPEGMKWKYTGKGDTRKIVLVDGKPQAVPKGKRNKKEKAQYAPVEGGYTSSVTPGFIVGEHKKLVMANFQDPLNYAEWNVWYCKQLLERAEKEVENMRALGATPEARKANVEASKAVNAIENFLAKQKLAGVSNSALQERLMKILAETSVG